MILIQCTNDTQPADFLMLAQSPNTYELLGWSATGTEYAGDFVGFECRVGTSNELGSYDNTDPMNPAYTPPSNAGVAVIFNAAQDELRRTEYRKKNGLDEMVSEAYRKDIHPRYAAQDRQAARQRVADEFDRVELLHPKV
ncbi:hypothetical protein N9924_00720 [bacterium]|nr:hypothetical protein [bacterium]